LSESATATQHHVIEAAAAVVEEDQILENASCGGGRSAYARLLVAPLVDVVGLAECLEIGSIAKEIEADVRDVLLKEWKLWIGISDISCNAVRIFIAVCQASFFCLRTHGLSESATATQHHVIEAAAAVVEEDQILENASCGGGRSAYARLLVAPLVDVVGLAESLEVGSITKEIEANVRDVFLKEWKLWIGISDISCNTVRIFIAVCQASFFCLRAHGLSESATAT